MERVAATDLRRGDTCGAKLDVQITLAGQAQGPFQPHVPFGVTPFRAGADAAVLLADAQHPFVGARSQTSGAGLLGFDVLPGRVH